MNMHNERIFVVNPDGGTIEDTFTPMKEAYTKIRAKYNNGTYMQNLMDKMAGKFVDKDGDVFIHDFISNLDKTTLDRLVKELPEDDMLQAELVKRLGKS